MFEQIKATETAKNPDLQEFLTLYAKFQAGARWLAEREAKGLDNTPHLMAFRLLESDVDQQWDRMSNEQKESILDALAASGDINKEVCQAKELFAGQLVKIT